MYVDLYLWLFCHTESVFACRKEFEFYGKHCQTNWKVHMHIM